MTVKLHDVVIKTFCHETEDLEKVKKVFFRMFPQEIDEKIIEKGLHLSTIHGHYGNRIIVLDGKYPAKIAKKVLKHVLTQITRTISLDEYFQNHFNSEAKKLYIRLSKHHLLNPEPYYALVRGGDNILLTFKFHYFGNKQLLEKEIKQFIFSLLHDSRV